MAQFDLKKATIYLVDGHATEGAVENVAGYPTGTTTMVVAGFTDEVPLGTTFKLAGDDNIYEITAQTPTLGATTSITFTPGLLVAAVDAQVIEVSGRRLEIKIGDGNLTFDEKRTMEYKKDRGILDTVREGDEEPIDVRLDIRWDWLSSAGTDVAPTPKEALQNAGLASDWISSSDDPCEPYALDIVVVYDPECADVEAEVITLPDYRYESLNHDAKAGTMSTSGKCNATKALMERLTLA